MEVPNSIASLCCSSPSFDPLPTPAASALLLHSDPRCADSSTSCAYCFGPIRRPGFGVSPWRDLAARTSALAFLGGSSSPDHRPPLQLLPASYGVRRNASEEEGKSGRRRTSEGGRRPHQRAAIALLNHVLSLLPAEEAVRTCVLAQRWHHLWKSAPALRIGYLNKSEPKSSSVLRKFVDYLLLLRGGLPLDKFKLRLGRFSGPDDVPRVNLWLWHALMCKVQVLKLHLHDNDRYRIYPVLELDDLPLVSKYLTKLQLRGVRCHASFLNFSSCPALEHLEFVSCRVSSGQKISSEYLKYLSITNSVFSQDSRIRICAPNLVSLRLVDLWCSTPILESMPGLAEAFVRITQQFLDLCNKQQDPHQDCDCEYCDSSNNIGDGADNCMLLKGLLEAKSLVLISNLDTFIFKSDLRWCPTFKKLKTLLLNEYWCVPDLHALTCILEHSPNLEKLTFQLFSKGPKHKVEMNGSFSSMERSVGISEHLKIVEVKCEVIDERVLKVLQFLCTFSIPGLDTRMETSSSMGKWWPRRRRFSI